MVTKLNLTDAFHTDAFILLYAK